MGNKIILITGVLTVISLSGCGSSSDQSVTTSANVKGGGTSVGSNTQGDCNINYVNAYNTMIIDAQAVAATDTANPDTTAQLAALRAFSNDCNDFFTKYDQQTCTAVHPEDGSEFRTDTTELRKACTVANNALNGTDANNNKTSPNAVSKLLETVNKENISRTEE